MTYFADQPFPQKPDPTLATKTGKEAIDDYLKTFEELRKERPPGLFDDADVDEIMQMEERCGVVADSDLQYIDKQLLRDRGSYFGSDAQKTRLHIFINNHRLRNAALDRADFVGDILEIPPISCFRSSDAAGLIQTVQDLSATIEALFGFWIEHGNYAPNLIDKINDLSAQSAAKLEALCPVESERSLKEKLDALCRDLHNFFRVLSGAPPDHEAKWNAASRKWENWNRDVGVFPVDIKNPTNLIGVQDLITANRIEPIRLVAGGHSFNTSTDSGGTEAARTGLLITLDNHELCDDMRWTQVSPEMSVSSYNVSPEQSNRVVRVSAGMRLRDFSAAMFARGWALPVAGSTDAQSIGGLIATDLHSTGRKAGFLSQQLLEVLTLDATGEAHCFVKDDGSGNNVKRRWEWKLRGGPTLGMFSKLAVAGALGMTGVVVEAVLKLDEAFNVEKKERYVPRAWAEEHIGEILDAHDHVSFYYAGGNGPKIKTVRLNTWNRTAQAPLPNALDIKRQRELFDHIGSGFLPNFLLTLSGMTAATPGTVEKSDPLIELFNARLPLVLHANHAFARKLFFQHDEIEVGIVLGNPPDLDVFRRAVKETQKLIKSENFKTVIEVRFTPDTSEGMLGPGGGGPTCYIELAPSMFQHSRKRIVEVFNKCDVMMRRKFNARPHLGKKTSATADDLKRLHGESVWNDFNEIRRRIDPDGKFCPSGNELLKRLFT